MKMIYRNNHKNQIKFLFSISIVGLSLLMGLITSCSSDTPSDEIPPVAQGSELINFTNRNSSKIWRDNKERYLKGVNKSLYKEGGITQSIIQLNQRKNHIMTVDELIFLLESCEYKNQQACEFIQSRQNQF
ncbi:MAG: hypothetical protein KI793_33635 [Rivularia sp. (in: Bacteria)]|nr:hypothetical protein [Rivularia sp. MS3]